MKMPFGKFKDQDIVDIPDAYIYWALEKWDWDKPGRARLLEEFEAQVALRKGEGRWVRYS